MKKAFSLVEVLVSVMLIVGVIATIIKTKDNSLFFLEKFKQNSFYNGVISMITQNKI
jgi:type II secretory pathway pseudopilin PulG